ncbi:hypothetical protein JB92DRAFT_2916095 [Gautieria morchelliformis]|nr:hypothetical protein JB92DRAFT_2916095 [Gautieria morchelliformis]
MGRTKGTKNRVGHKAGGSRKGSGRKPKSLVGDSHPPSLVDMLQGKADGQPTLRSSPFGSSDTQDPSGNCQVSTVSSSINGDFMDAHQRHSSLGLYFDSPDHIHRLTPIPDPQVPTLSAEEAAHCSRSPQHMWDSAPDETPFLGIINSSPVPSHLICHPQSPTQIPAPFGSHLPSYFSATTSGCNELTPRSESTSLRSSHRLDVESLDMVIDISPEYTPNLPPPCNSETHQSADFDQSDTVVPPCDSASSSQSQPQLPSSDVGFSRDPLGHITSTPLSHEQDTWMFPYPLPASVTAPVHCLAIVSQSSTHKRRRRRCIVCLQVGKKEASYECPGRGDRTRCPSRREGGADRSVPSRQQKWDQKVKEQERPLPSQTMSTLTPSPVIDHGDGATYDSCSPQPTHIIPPKAVLNTRIAHPAVVPYGYSKSHTSQRFTIENVKRRSRRCMVCVARDKDGTSCPGRGNRALCPNREGGVV